MASLSSQVQEDFKYHSGESAGTALHARRWDAKVDRQTTIANELSRLVSDEYLEDITQHARAMEDETLPDSNFIDMQREIQWYMRPYLIDFLIGAHTAFSLLRETLFLTINLIDRYCSKRMVYKQHYQLVGCAALLIAAKYNDKDTVPKIDELNNICCGLYDAGMFTQMEMHILNTLDWNIGHPTVAFFQSIVWAEEQDDHEVRDMTAYICEIALYHRDFVSTKPSTMAQASHALARAILLRPEVNDGEGDHDAQYTLLALSQYLHQPSVTLSRKYSSNHFSHVSIKLVDFLAQQANRSKHQGNGPATPPAEYNSSHPTANIYSTLYKGHGCISGAAEGNLTPPITPDGSFFGPDSQNYDSYTQVPPRCPVMPTPHAGLSSTQLCGPLCGEVAGYHSSSGSLYGVTGYYTWLSPHDLGNWGCRGFDGHC